MPAGVRVPNPDCQDKHIQFGLFRTCNQTIAIGYSLYAPCSVNDAQCMASQIVPETPPTSEEKALTNNAVNAEESGGRGKCPCSLCWYW